MQLIAQRTEVARRIGRIKGARALPVRDAVRERALLEKRRGWAEEEALDPDGVARVFEERWTSIEAIERDTGLREIVQASEELLACRKAAPAI